MEELKELLLDIQERIARVEDMLRPNTMYYSSYYDWLEEEADEYYDD